MIRYFFVPEQVDDNTRYTPHRYTFELSAARHLLKTYQARGERMRIVAAERVDPSWIGKELNAMPSIT